MPCYVQKLEDGTRILRGDFGPPCTHCAWISDYLCDYPVGQGKTCDARMCEKHGTEVAPNIHYCPGHLEEWKKFKDAGGVKRELSNVTPYSRSGDN